MNGVKHHHHSSTERMDMSNYEKTVLNDMVDEIFRGFTIGLPVMLIIGSIFFELIVKGV